jgi:histidyl-tRNA synthetase
MQLQPVRGTKDILPDDYVVYLELLAKAKQVVTGYGYQEISIPIFEFSEVFKRTLGDYSDVVTKEMYSFEDRGGQSITLRPEHTAGIARCIISNGLQHLLPLKLFTIGPNFRYERPQKGRQRQFHQMTVEAIGYNNPIIDVEVMALAANILKALNIFDKTRLEINTLGDNESRALYLSELTKYLFKYKNDLSEESKVRLEKNPLRVLDSKDPNDKKIVADAPVIYDSLNAHSKKFFDQVLESLTQIGIKFVLNSKIVRGLDYYSHTAFEFVTEELGSQGTVIGGGRYDDLYKIMGNHDIPAVGFAMGIERAFELYNIANPKSDAYQGIFVVSLSGVSDIQSLKIAEILRSKNITVYFEQINNVAKAIKKAVVKKAEFMVIVGEDEIKEEKFKLKNLVNRDERVLNIDELVNFVESHEF